VEEALRVRERLGAGEVVAITVGDEEAESALRRCLAMGADRAVRIDAEPLDPISTARALAPAVAAETPDLVLAGVQSADSVQGSTGTALAELVGLPRVAVVTRLEWDGSGPARVDRELEGGLVDVVEVETPALLTIQTGINQPRYANLRAIKQADQQEIKVVAAETGGPAYRVRRMFTPPRGEGAQLLDGGPAQVAERILELVQERLA
jgi:electron transfer flavoprotein alpha/beta subunit